MAGLVLALAPGEDPLPTKTESWCDPDQLGGVVTDNAIDLQDVCDVTTDMLYLLSGRRFGVRRETIRPYAGWRAIGWTEAMIAAEYGIEVLGADYRFGNFQCGPDFLTLKAPVQSVDTIKIDGQVVDPSQFFIYNNRTLVRRETTGGGAPWWPLGQDLNLPDTEPGTFSITYQWGEPVSIGGKLAAVEFAKELAKKLCNEPCALPDRTVTVNRQGISQTIIDPSQFIAQARTGLYFVDIWLATVNPSGQRARTIITSPEKLRQLRSS